MLRVLALGMCVFGSFSSRVDRLNHWVEAAAVSFFSSSADWAQRGEESKSLLSFCIVFELSEPDQTEIFALTITNTYYVIITIKSGIKRLISCMNICSSFKFSMGIKVGSYVLLHIYMWSSVDMACRYISNKW